MPKAKEKEEEDEPVEWTPDQPIPDDEGEEMAQRQHMLKRRVAFLDEQAEKTSKKRKKESGSRPWLLG